MPWQQICRIYPIKAHSIILYTYSAYKAILIFHHSDFPERAENLEKNITKENIMLPWKQNCFLYRNDMRCVLSKTMKGKVFII